MNYGFAAIADICVDWIGRNVYYAELYTGNICKWFLHLNNTYITLYVKLQVLTRARLRQFFMFENLLLSLI